VGGGSAQQDARTGRLAAGATFVVVHVALLLYLRFWVNPAFVYYWPEAGFPNFLMRSSFFQRFVAMPGGMGAYASAFLSQLLYFPWAGAAVIVVLSAIVCSATGSLIRQAAGRRPSVLHLWPAVLVAVCYGQYAHVLPMLTVVAVAASAAAGYARLPVSRPLLRASVAVAAALPLYYVSGGGSVVFAVLCIIIEVRRGAAVPVSANALAALAVPLLVGMGLMHREPAACYPPLLDFVAAPTMTAVVAVACLLIIVPACTGVSVLAAALAGRCAPGRRMRWVAPAAFSAVAACLVWATSSPRLRTLLELEFACEHRQWPRVLECARRLPAADYMQLVDMSVNRALYHSGTMGDNLFLFPQQQFGLFRRPEEYAGAVAPGARPPEKREYVRGCEVFFELGRMNEDEHLATEALQYQGARPWILERLAMIQTVKGDHDAARTFLQALAGDVVRGGRARWMLARLEEDPEALVDDEVRRLRALMVRDDSAGPRSVDDVLRELLAANGSNRMAFEYLMADYLLKGSDLDALAGEMHRLDDLGYERIPRLYEEALLVLLYLGKPVDLGGRTISIESRMRFADFLETMNRHPDDPRAALPELDPPARFSFMAYYFLHLRAGGGA
jgi:hypothetical protein